MKKVILNFAALFISCSMILSCGNKNEGSANASNEATSTENTNASPNASVLEKSESNKESTKNDQSNKEIDLLINQYEDGVNRKASLINNPPMNPDAAMRDLDAIDAELNGITGKLNAMTLSEEQKTRFNSAKAKNKKLS